MRCMSFKHKYLLSLLFFCKLLFPISSGAQSTPVGGATRNDFKMTLLSLGSGSTRITYERAFSQRHSGEITLGLIGLGWDWMNKTRPQGLLMKMAYKWRYGKNRASDDWLSGFYFKPELVLASFKYGKKLAPGAEPPKCPKTTNQMALLAEIGY